MFSIKEENLHKIATGSKSDKAHEVCIFWPDANLTAHRIPNWPSNVNQENDFLVKTFGFKTPQVIGGVTREGVPKPDFMFYYDVDNTTAKVNKWANNIGKLLPSYERQKYPAPKSKKGYRGACVLLYSPMISFGTNGNLPDSSEGLKFSINDMKNIIQFHSTDEATRMYASHDNPMHRMFGGLNFA